MQCADHDFIEVACLYGYQLKISLRDNQHVVGQAFTTQVKRCGNTKVELLILQTNTGQQSVILNDIVQIEALTANDYFSVLKF